jgi:hypothetical protein
MVVTGQLGTGRMGYEIGTGRQRQDKEDETTRK